VHKISHISPHREQARNSKKPQAGKKHSRSAQLPHARCERERPPATGQTAGASRSRSPPIGARTTHHAHHTSSFFHSDSRRRITHHE
jgi:hypothetical protein